MGNVTKNMSRHELDCKCGNCEVTILPEEPVIQLVQAACDHFATKHGIDRVILEITSAARCYEYNRKPAQYGGPGSNDNSQHPRACAIDHKIFLLDRRQVSPLEIYEYYDRLYPSWYGIGNYINFTHIDTRPVIARWDKTKG